MKDYDLCNFYYRDYKAYQILINYRESKLKRVSDIFTPNLIIAVPQPNLTSNPFEWILKYFRPDTILFIADWLTLNPDLVATFPLKDKNKKIVNTLFKFAQQFKTSFNVAKAFGYVAIDNKLWKFLNKRNKISLDYYLCLVYKHRKDFHNNYRGIYAHFIQNLDLEREFGRIMKAYRAHLLEDI
ncbi:hypothetical protein J7J62_08175 [bacterium]|nr:hypothetical protein [bacterium]